MIVLGLDSNCPEKPEIQYPCEWIYKVIGEDRALLHSTIEEICSIYATPKITHSLSSSKGKYHSLQIEITVPSEAIRLDIYEKLKTSPAVKIVL